MYMPLCSDLRIQPVVVSSFTISVAQKMVTNHRSRAAGELGMGLLLSMAGAGGRAGQQLCGPTQVRKNSPAGSQGGGSQGSWPSELLAEGYVKAWEACLGFLDQQGRGPGFAVLTLAPSWLLRRRARPRNS